ncbi:MAG: UDP-3-O-(3-hydroxymyristoyl)glucosamine N-acyltransferase [Cupriavidus sp.]|nr:UDP-3-O-(3-hydroxymyristoyl)glucosamine N-acyltransferase [Cupriavidus sp.]
MSSPRPPSSGVPTADQFTRSPAVPQRTLATAFARSGPGLHTAGYTNVCVSPAEADTGIVFRRRLKDGKRVIVPALWHASVPQPLCTALQAADGSLVRTVEHLLAALSASGVDNAVVDLDAEELPILDGSAAPWCEAIRQAGLTQLTAPRRSIRVRKRVCVEDGRRSITITPADHLFIEARLALAHFGEMSWHGSITPQIFAEELAPSRSFGRLKWALPLKFYARFSGRSLLRGANLSTTAAIFGNRIIGGMRVPDEPVRHRILDLIGDLSLAGHPIHGHVSAAHTGHSLNHALVAKLMRDPTSWELV